MIRTCVVGASGYSGAELLRLLAARDDVVVTNAIASTSAGKRIDELYPIFTGTIDAAYQPFDPDLLDDADVAFIALPSGESMKIVPNMVQRVSRVIDLSGDFRLPDTAIYEDYYRHEHTSKDLCTSAVYGLPELNGARIAEATLVANPGCYATSVILGLVPLLAQGVIVPEGISVTSMSGASGAGRSASVEMSFAELNDNVRAYKVPKHQHIPEIEHVLRRATGKDVTVSFVPHLVPLTRGIYTTIQATLNTHVTDDDLEDMIRSYYRGSQFIRYRRHPPQIRDVVLTNFCDLACTVDRRTNSVIIFAVLDNLLKGAAGQAVQNMNIMFGLPEHQGLLQKGATVSWMNA